ncbi:glycoside hydrolase family 76 protein [Herbiconiux sp. P16]|uniref:glycoside hydrolase family 76 protein n=1 Tax=Herbiconiux wuyangfengii TaxID=3342794 RepID=UPI0035B868B1
MDAGTDARTGAAPDAGDGAWSARAERAQDALTAAFATRLRRGGLRNTAPWRLRQAFAFNYWWLAHAIEVRVDAFDRSGDASRLSSARRLLQLLRRRNRGTLINDYFDDMGWLAIALLRVHAATGERPFLGDAVGLWEHIRHAGWNARHGASVAWRQQQPDYKNAPTNGAFALLSARLLAATGEPRYARAVLEALDWIETSLVDPSTGIVADGVNRQGDGALDTDWVFSYNQGLYVSALVEVAGRRDGVDAPVGGLAGIAGEIADSLADRPADALARAERTAVAAVGRLAPTGVITTENSRFDQRGGGDIGLFKGVFVRSLGDLIPRLPAESASRRLLADFVRTSTDALWSSIRRSPELRAGDDWSRPAPPVTFLSTQLSAVMALEARAGLERNGVM